MTLLENLYRFLQPLQRRIVAIVSKAVLLEYRHSGKMPLLKVQLGADELKDNVELIQPYGFAARPLKGAEVLTLFIGGVRDHGVAVVVDSSGDRIKLNADGDVCIFRRSGEKIYLSEGKIKIEAATVELSAGEVKLSNGAALDKLMNKVAMDAFNAHTHLVSAVASTPPAPPIPTLTPTVPMVEGVHTTTKTKGA